MDQPPKIVTSSRVNRSRASIPAVRPPSGPIIQTSRLQPYAAEEPPKISFCMALKNRWENLQHCLPSLMALSQHGPMELVISDFQSTDIHAPDVMRMMTDIPTVVGRGPEDFNRSLGLNVAARNSSGGYDDLLFFLDADMILPPNFCQLLRQRVQRGRCWFPICYSLYADKPREVDGDEPPPGGDHRHVPQAANGWWRKEGQGMCGFTRGDFLALGGWDEEIGKTYGKEDNDLFRRANEHLTVIRENCPGLFHLWHPPYQRSTV
jgi:glycosyltransferase involved in cell wall biosynthesis